MYFHGGETYRKTDEGRFLHGIAFIVEREFDRQLQNV